MRKLFTILLILALFSALGWGQAYKYKHLKYNTALVSKNNSLGVFKSFTDEPFDMWAVRYDSPTTYQMTIKGGIGKVMQIDWGDNQDTTFTFSGSDQIIRHFYAQDKYFYQVWTVDKLAITKIVANNQHLKLGIPIAIRGFENLTYLALQINQLEGDITLWGESIEKMTDLTVFQLNSNPNLSGNLSNWNLSNLINMQYFYLYSCDLSGNLSNWNLSNWSNLRNFFLHVNNFEGDLSNIGITASNINNYFVYSNDFTNVSYIPTTRTITYNCKNNNISNAANVDKLFEDYRIYYDTHTPTNHFTINISGGTNATPTGGVNNVDIVALTNIFNNSGTGYSFIAIINP